MTPLAPTPTDTLNAWLKAAGAALELNLSLNAERQCILELDEQLTCIIELTQAGDGVFFYTTITDLPSEPAAAHPLCLKALSLNFLQVQTRGGVLGLSPDGVQLIYSHFEALEQLTEKTFSGTLMNFLETAGELYKTLNQE